MRTFIRRTLALLLALLLPLTALADVTDDYLAAQTLLAQSRFAEAAVAFGKLGSYEDASMLAMYCRACALAEAGHYDAGIAVFKSMENYKDCKWRITYYEARKLEATAGDDDWNSLLRAQESYYQIPLFLDSLQRIAGLNGRVVAAMAGTTDQDRYIAIADFYTSKSEYLDSSEYTASLIALADAVVAEKYAKVDALISAGQYEEAKDILLTFGTYGSELHPAKYYAMGEHAAAAGNFPTARFAYRAAGDYSDAVQKSTMILAPAIERAQMFSSRISVSSTHVAALQSYGTVVVAGTDSTGTAAWKEVIAVAAGKYNTFGLRADGTVVADLFLRNDGQAKVTKLQNVIAIAAGENHIVCLRSNGTVYAFGENEEGQCNVRFWKDIVAISAGPYHTVGLQADGTVVAVGSNNFGQCNTSGWKDIVAISAGNYHTVGLRADGSVIAVGDGSEGQCSVNRWEYIVAIAAGGEHTVGLKEDGTVVAVGNDFFDQCTVSRQWKDVVGIASGSCFIVALFADGTVDIAGWAFDDYKTVKSWDLLN